MSIKESHERFRHIIKGKIRQNLQKYIKNQEMLGKREGDIVRIPLPEITLPHFCYGPKKLGGIGMGKDTSGESGPFSVGNQEGEHHLEAEISMEELTELLGEALELPRIQPKASPSLSIPKNRYSGLSSVGPESLRSFRSSYKKALKRSIVSGEYNPKVPLVVPIRSDFRYRTARKILQPSTCAVVIYMMDISGSMGKEQKELVRTEVFWIQSWLKKHYKNLKTCFIIHDTAAKEVDEKTFFNLSEAGGTLISSAYKLCRQMILEKYPFTQWNVYPFHFSDGDNWSMEDSHLCMKLISEFFSKNTNLFCYGQVKSQYGSGAFLKEFQKHFPHEGNILFNCISDKDDILNSIKHFLGKGK